MDPIQIFLSVYIILAIPIAIGMLAITEYHEESKPIIGIILIIMVVLEIVSGVYIISNALT